MKVAWTKGALEDYRYWQRTDPKIAARIERLIAEIKAMPFAGIGKPEPLKHELAGWWSRRITREHRLVNRVQDDWVIVAQCRYHY
jgi:toxin YoeB